MSSLRDRARGRWRGILTEIGIPASCLDRKNRPCPLCRTGKDRFRFLDTDGNGTWVCNACGTGSGTELVKKFLGLEFRDAAQRIESVIGTVHFEAPRAARDEQALRLAKRRLWRESSPVEAGDPVARYLASRGIGNPPPTCLRTHLRTYYERDVYYPAMLALVCDGNGKPVNIHRTYLTMDGLKAPVEESRKMMPGPMGKGGAVCLTPPAEVMGIAEGIETALSATILFGVPTWAAISSSGMADWIPPRTCRKVIVFADCDAKYGGQLAAYRLAHRLSVQVDPLEVEVKMPSKPGMDWNDVLMGG